MTSKPLPALLSQALVAYSIEFGYEFARSMGREPWSLSLFGWSNCWQYIEPSGMPVRTLGEKMRGEAESFLGKYERWGFLEFEPDPADPTPIPRTFVRLYGREERDGYGSTRGIKRTWIVR